jgi:hypothetical protein
MHLFTLTFMINEEFSTRSQAHLFDTIMAKLGLN